MTTDGGDSVEGETAGQPGDAQPAAAVPRRHRVLRIVGPVLAVLVVALAWGGWQLWQLASDFLGLRDVAAQAQAHVRAGDLAGLTGDVAHARELAARARTDADAPAVVAAAGWPWIGDDVRIARELAGVVADLSDGTAGVDPLLAKLAGGATPDLLVAADAGDVIGEVRTAADAAATRLGALDVSPLALPVGDDIVRVRTALTKVGPAVDALSPYLKALTILASPHGEHTWLVAMQNLGESRPSGGMLGAWLLVRGSSGRIEVLEQGSNKDLQLEQAIDYAGYLPAGYEQVFGDTMRDWRSLNMSAHFPDDARLFTHAWNDRGKRQADGVVALGQGTVRFLAAAAGPVTAGGRTIAPSDLADYLSVGVYRDHLDPKEKDAAVADIVAQILRRLSGGHFDVPSLLAAALSEPNADYLQLWSADRAVQKEIETAGLSGAFGDEPGPVASVRLANGAANKLDSFLHLGAEYRLGSCVTDDGGVATRNSSFRVTLRNAVPGGLPDYVTGKGDLLDGQKHPVGATRDFVLVYPPVQATLTAATVDGRPAFVQSAWVGGRQMLVFDVKLDPGASATIEMSWDELPTDADDKPFPLTPRLVLPPLSSPADTAVVAASACG